MKALILTSDRPRHRHFAASIAAYFDAPVAMVEQKKNYYVAQQQSELVRFHFDRIAAAELQWFVCADGSRQPEVRYVTDVNAVNCVEWARQQAYDVVCLYGTSVLGDGWLQAFPDRIINLHLGLSPYYRGSATLFWPFVNRELHHLGTTIHVASAKVDAGNILQRVLPDLREHEDYYAITNRLIRDSIERFPLVVDDYLAGRIVPEPQEAIRGRFYRKADFTEDTLHAALAYVDRGLSADEIRRIQKKML